MNILKSLIGSKNIEADFENLITKYPEALKCIHCFWLSELTKYMLSTEMGVYI